MAKELTPEEINVIYSKLINLHERLKMLENEVKETFSSQYINDDEKLVVPKKTGISLINEIYYVCQIVII